MRVASKHHATERAFRATDALASAEGVPTFGPSVLHLPNYADAITEGCLNPASMGQRK